MFTIAKGWFRYRVYQLGHSIGDETWLGSFRHREHAVVFARAMAGTLPRAEDPIDPVPSPPDMERLP